jgi:hypothetical protein
MWGDCGVESKQERRKANTMKWKLMTRLNLLAGFLAGFASVAQAFYNPDTGRWLNRDPIGERGGINLFAAMGNWRPLCHNNALIFPLL